MKCRIEKIVSADIPLGEYQVLSHCQIGGQVVLTVGAIVRSAGEPQVLGIGTVILPAGARFDAKKHLLITITEKGEFRDFSLEQGTNRIPFGEWFKPK